MSDLRLRFATRRDVDAISAIYAPIVEHTAISFEAVPPSPAEFIARLDETMPEYPWLVAVGTDVTAEQEMLRRAMRAERLAAVGTLAAGLAHEVRNPLNSAALQLEVLERRLDRGETAAEALRPVCVLVRDEIRRLERLVSDFLSFVHPRPLDLKPTDLEQLCRSVLDLVRTEAEPANIRLVVEIPRYTINYEREGGGKKEVAR